MENAHPPEYQANKSLSLMSQRKVVQVVISIFAIAALVGVVGYFTYSHPIKKTDKVPIIPQETIQGTRSEKRQIFRIDKFGIEFEIPEGLVRVDPRNPREALPISAVVPDKDEGVFVVFRRVLKQGTVMEECFISFGVEQNPSRLPLTEWVRTAYEGTLLDSGDTIEEINVANTIGIRYKSLADTKRNQPPTEPTTMIFISHNDIIFVMDILVAPSTAQCEQDFEQILRSFSG